MKILLLIIAFTLASCTKDEKICWECELVTSTPSGGSSYVDICNDSETPPDHYEDGNGNSWRNMGCERK